MSAWYRRPRDVCPSFRITFTAVSPHVGHVSDVGASRITLGHMLYPPVLSPPSARLIIGRSQVQVLAGPLLAGLSEMAGADRVGVGDGRRLTTGAPPGAVGEASRGSWNGWPPAMRGGAAVVEELRGCGGWSPVLEDGPGP